MTDLLISKDEAQLRIRAARRGFFVMRVRGGEEKRRRKAGMGQYMLLDTQSNSVAVFAADLEDIERFLKADKRQQQQHLH
jgi:hypothetical protein